MPSTVISISPAWGSKGLTKVWLQAEARGVYASGVDRSSRGASSKSTMQIVGGIEDQITCLICCGILYKSGARHLVLSYVLQESQKFVPGIDVNIFWCACMLDVSRANLCQRMEEKPDEVC